ncbi:MULTISPECIES: DNA methyltransferase [unclassified Rathayibacter]|uniref:DNA methyltransferase n=1 Tax=unclassified Rathayibacter TaxID=2609250 RepID=UPI0010613FEB|nr:MULTISPECIES: DNA methyltransferase [unclassified Rathayibacter]
MKPSNDQPLGSAEDDFVDLPRCTMSTVTASPPSTAALLATRLAARSAADATFWDFSSIYGRDGGHGYFQYPAMMVPELQRALLEDLVAVDPRVSRVYDPFMGSGTVMLESLYLGLDFIGSDINPMAVLLSAVKADPPASDAARQAGVEVLARARRSRRSRPITFNFRDKWFEPDVSLGLTRLRFAIQAISDQQVRRFLWVCLAETVRFVSNSRPSTFKLHLYSDADLAARKPDAVRQFAAVLVSNVERIRAHERTLIRTAHAPTLLRASVNDALPPRTELADVLMTSPPYGDNHTTVPYGQYSYLPLQWIDPADLVGDVDPSDFEVPGRLDTLSLGGNRYTARPVPAHLRDEVPSLVKWLSEREVQDATTQKVVTFVDDYRIALRHAIGRVRAGGFAFLTLGERRVSGADVPLVRFTQEVLEAAGLTWVTRVERLLPSRKRIATRNARGETMIRETVLVMQKA